MNQAKRDAPFVAVISGVRVSANPGVSAPGHLWNFGVDARHRPGMALLKFKSRLRRY
jgi:hypothetical protein